MHNNIITITLLDEIHNVHDTQVSHENSWAIVNAIPTRYMYVVGVTIKSENIFVPWEFSPLNLKLYLYMICAILLYSG